MAEISFVVLGEPKALKRHRTFRRGKFIGQYDPSLQDKEDFVAVVQQNAPKELIRSPIFLDVRFFFGRPKSHYGIGKNASKLKNNVPTAHTKRPDIDNLLKFIMDSLDGIFWVDDAQIFQVAMTKEYSEKPRTAIIVCERYNQKLAELKGE